MKSAVAHAAANEKSLKSMLDLAKAYNKRLEEAEGKSEAELTVSAAGRLDPKKHLEMEVDELLTNNISQTLGLLLDTVIF